MKEWYVQIDGFVSGPLSASELKKLVEKGKLTPETPIRKEGQQHWSKAEKVKGLFGEKSLIRKPQEIIVEQPKSVVARIEKPPTTKACPFCGESILLDAIKCRFCNEYLDESKRPQSGSNYPSIQINQNIPAQPMGFVNTQPVHHTTVVHMHGSREKWSRGTAAVLSFLIPGLGQMYKGQLFNGLLWFVLTIIGYILFIIPGIILHILCIFGAASGDNTK